MAVQLEVTGKVALQNGLARIEVAFVRASGRGDSTSSARTASTHGRDPSLASSYKPLAVDKQSGARYRSNSGFVPDSQGIGRPKLLTNFGPTWPRPNEVQLPCWLWRMGPLGPLPKSRGFKLLPLLRQVRPSLTLTLTPVQSPLLQPVQSLLLHSLTMRVQCTGYTKGTSSSRA